MTTPDGACRPSSEAGDLLDIRLKTQVRQSRPLVLLGQVVRCTARPTGDGYDVAVHFQRLSQDDQDVLINLAFKVRYEQLGA